MCELEGWMGLLVAKVGGYTLLMCSVAFVHILLRGDFSFEVLTRRDCVQSPHLHQEGATEVL